MTNKIVSIGVELEGGMDYADKRKVATAYGSNDRFEMKNDGSVHVHQKEDSNMEMTYWSTKTKDVFDFIGFCYANGFETDDSCGLHVHVRFSDMESAVAMLSLPKPQQLFIRLFKDKFGDNPKYMNRLTNNYCKARYNENAVVAQITREAARYHAVNLAAYGKHGTVEFRLLPRAKTGTEAVSAIRWLLNTVTKILNQKLMKGVVMKTVPGFRMENYTVPGNMELEIHELTAEGLTCAD